MSSTAACSSSLCMVALGRPKSTTGQSCDQEAAVRRAAAGRELGLDRRSRPRIAATDDVVDRPGRGQEGLAGNLRLDRRAGRRRARRCAATSATRSAPRWRLLKRMLSWARRRAGNDVGRLRRRLDTPVISRLEGGKASLPSSRWSASSAAITRASFGHRIVGAVRVGDMALHAGHVDPHVDRAAPADLDDVAEPRLRGRLADQDHVGADAALGHPVDDRAACRRWRSLPRRR